jgi:hypothetical protein
MKKNLAYNILLMILATLSCIPAASGQAVVSEKASIRINTTDVKETPDPELRILAPGLKEGVSFQSPQKTISLGMQLINPSEGLRVMVNNAEVDPTAAGDVYIKSLDLSAGSNTVVISITRDDRTIKEYFYNLIYLPEVKNISPFALNTGKYYALIIGNSDYVNPEIPDLIRPAEDARELREVLLSKYTFEREDIYYLIDRDKDNVLLALDELTRRLTPDDNLLIFYAGHGKMDEENDIGYWLLRDAQPARQLTWLSNGQVTEMIKVIKARHVLLIADACYAGSIYQARSIDDAPASIIDLYREKSRKAITSGGSTEVSDNSKFAEYMIDALRINESKYMSSNQLYSKILTPVQNNSLTSPRWGVIQNVGDRGGDFIFIQKDQ